jgi:methionyl-tRNA formyltransferase
LRIIFAGSPEIAVPALEALLDPGLEEAGIELAGVLTNPDSPRGRRGATAPTEVGAAATALSELLRARGKPPPVLMKPPKLDALARDAAAALRPDLLVSFAYGRIFGPKFLALFPLGGINIHPSLLPKYRGAAPIPAAILGRDRETGVTIQRLAPEMDAGDILAQERFPLDGRETTGTLSETAARRGAAMLPPVLLGLCRGTLRGRPQNHDEAVYCGLIAREDGLLDWAGTAADIDARIRAFNPWPLCRTRHGDRDLYILEGEPRAGADQGSAGPEPVPVVPGSVPAPRPGTVLGIDKGRGILVQTGKGVFVIRRLQYAARNALEWRAFLNGVKDFIGSRLG